MHRWHFQRLTRALVPVLLLVTLLCVVMVGQQKIVGSRSFLADESYGHLAVVRNILNSGVYAYGAGETIPVVRDTLWRILVCAATWIVRDPISALYLVGALCSVISVLLMVRLARLLFPFPPFLLFACSLLIVSAQFLVQGLSGTSSALAACLVTGACLLHIEGLLGRRTALPVGLALVVGITLWIRIEFLVLWFVFSLHAWILAMCCSNRKARFTPGYVFLRSIYGLLILALCLLPLAIWNVYWINVPWPRVVGASLALDSWSMAPAETLGRSIAIYRAVLPRLFGEFYQAPFLQGWIQRIAFWLGCVVLMGLAVWRTEERPFTIILAVPFLLPVLYAVVYPYLDPSSVRFIYSAFSPLVVLVAAFGVFRLPFFLEGLYRKWKEGLPSARGFKIWLLAAGIVLLVTCMAHSLKLMKHRMRELEAKTKAREMVSDVIRAHSLSDKLFLTDAAGWLSYAHGTKLIDLRGEASLEVLRTLDADGWPNHAKIRNLLKKRDVQALFLWTEQSRFIEALVRTQRLYPRLGEDPDVLPRLLLVRQGR